MSLEEWLRRFQGGPHVQRMCSLLREYQAGDAEQGLVLFVGSGLSLDAGYPSVTQICSRLRDELQETDLSVSLEELAERYIDTFSRTDLSNILDVLFAEANEHAHSFQELLLGLPWRAVVTANYDPLLENAALTIRRPLHRVMQEDNIELDPRRRLPLYKVHGSIHRWRTAIVSGEDYWLLEVSYQGLYQRIDELIRSNSLVFLGFNPDNPHLLGHLEGMGTEGRRSLRRSRILL